MMTTPEQTPVQIRALLGDYAGRAVSAEGYAFTVGKDLTANVPKYVADFLLENTQGLWAKSDGEPGPLRPFVPAGPAMAPTNGQPTKREVPIDVLGRLRSMTEVARAPGSAAEREAAFEWIERFKWEAKQAGIPEADVRAAFALFGGEPSIEDPPQPPPASPPVEPVAPADVPRPPKRRGGAGGAGGAAEENKE